MNLLTIDDLSKQFSERVLFDGANLQINEGDRIGLVGVNGSGKSTLLKIIAGLEAPDAGDVTIWGNVRVEFLEQEPVLDDDLTVLETIFYSDSPQMRLLRDYQQVTAQLQQEPDNPLFQEKLTALSAELDRTDGWAAEANAKAVLTRLHTTNFGDKVGILSGGQRKRVALARALIDRADLLILDEPTNHIDADTVAWLEDYLAKTPGSLLMVTHDRYFLDRVVNRIVELDRRHLVSYPGNYSQYLAGRADRHERLASAEEKRRKHLAREMEWLRRSPMARGTKQKARKQRVEELMEIRYDSGDEQVMMSIGGQRLGSKVLSATNLTKQFDGHLVVDRVDFRLEPGERLGIIGPNGAGKSTMLNMLAGELTADAGTIEWGETVQLGYYDQRSIDLDDQMRLIEFIEHEAALIREAITTHQWHGRGARDKMGQQVEAAKMLEWFLFPRPMQYARIGSLSGGERRRLYLLRTLIHRPNVLFLDEPTNDLDVQTLAVLESFLDQFQGCLVVVSHDRYFLDRTVDHIASFENGKLGPRYPSPYSTFKRLYDEAQRAKGSHTRQVHASAHQSNPSHFPERTKKLRWKDEQELNALEKQIAELETQQTMLTEQMAASGADYGRLNELSAELEQVESTLEATMERWMELEEMRG
ncbi:ABC-F family ATP-binding cassette domain-containing protein [Chloroflexi bacterium TSY]|nr:ABC-F family ATP-binding cassette domain-containing protein [Chloroflexi bacterium TSY]